jgi:hypothetical protein
MSAAHRIEPNWNVRAIELDGIVYASTTVAMQELGIPRSLIRSRIKSGHGRYLTDSKYPVRRIH